MQNDGYNQLQLAFGNDGLRFLLDDMSFTANGTDYSHETVVSEVEAGNKAQNNSGDERWLSQEEMDAIIAKANELGIEIVPLLNLPGHANAILDIADDAYNASGSDNTLDVSNAKAVNFAMAIFQKYVDYFAEKGCQFFNFGADEYANDAKDGGAFSFSRLGQTGYANFAAFINGLAGYIDGKNVDGANMIPRAFNDGLYYMNSTDCRVYSGFYTMDTTTYSNIKKIQCCYWSSGWGSYPVAYADTIANNGHKMINTNGDFYYVLGKDDKFDSDYSYALNFTNSGFMGSTISNPVGSMFCIWCDYPNAETETEVAKKTRLVLRAMAQRMNNETVSVSDNVVANGFNADGTINNTVDDSLIKISIGDSTEAATSGELTVNDTMTLKANKQVDWTTSDAGVASIAASNPEAVMAAAETETETVNATAITVTAKKAGSATITATAGNKSATYAVTVSEPGPQTVTVTVGGTTEVTVDGNVTGTYETGNTGIATVTTEPVETETGTKYTPVTEVAPGTYYVSTQENDSAPTTEITIEKSGNQYYVKSGNAYYSPDASYNWYNGWSYSCTTGQKSVSVEASDGGFYISKRISINWNETTSYLTIKDGALSATGDQSKAKLYFYKAETVPAKTKTKITFKGVSAGTTSVTIGEVTYNINVIAEDLTKVTPLTIEYWVTNTRVTADNATSMDVSAAGVNSEEGTAISELVPLTGTTEQKHPAALWKGVRLLSNNKQTTAAGDDKTLAGDDFTYIRYWGGAWGFSADRTNWIQFNPTDQVVAYYMQRTTVTDEITTDVVDWGEDVGSVSWGPSGAYVELDFAVEYEDGQRTPDSFPVLYQDKSGKTRSKTMEFHCHTTDNYGNTIAAESRTIGRINAVETDQYEVYMITLTPNNDNKNTVLAQHPSTTSGFTYTYDGTEKVVWVDSEDNLGEFADTAKQAAGFRIGGEAAVDSLTIYKGQAMLVTYYVRAKVTADSLTVKYVNESTGNEFYSYSIAVASGTLFKDGIQLNNPWKQELINGDVVNYNGKTQNVTADLSKMPEISAAYRYSDYTCTRVEKSADGKTLTLYYTFNNVVSFIVDFGTPMEIKLTDLSADFQGNESKISSITVTNKNSYGKTEVNQKNKTITYTPEAKYATAMNGDELAVTVSGYNPETRKEGTITYTVDILPASNVLYEENFLTDGSVENSGWENEAVAHTDPQQTQKVGDSNKKVFGYDDSYASATNNNGVWKATGLKPNNPTQPLTTTFYGNTFDLIGTCGYHTGKVMLLIKTTDETPSRAKATPHKC